MPYYPAAAASGAPIDATYITQTANGTLTAEQNLAALATGLLKSTTTSGALSIGVAGTDYAGITFANVFTAAQTISGPTASTIPLTLKTTDNSTTNPLVKLVSSTNVTKSLFTANGNPDLRHTSSANDDTASTLYLGYSESIYTRIRMWSAGHLDIDTYGGGGSALIIFKNAGTSILSMDAAGAFSFTATQVIKSVSYKAWRVADTGDTNYTEYGYSYAIGKGIVNMVGSGTYGMVFQGDSVDKIFITKSGQLFVNEVFTYTPDNYQFRIRGTSDWIQAAIRAYSSQTASILEIQDSSANILSRFNKAGFFMTRKVAAPADADLATSEMALWLDNTAGAAKLKIKAKDSAGTVMTGEVVLA